MKTSIYQSSDSFNAECKGRRTLFRIFRSQRAVIVAAALVFAAMQAATQAATVTVTGTGDTIAVDGLVTLREAITSANNNANVNADVVAVGTYGTDTIGFNVPGAGVHTITPASSLPQITDPVIIDGYTQPGASQNTLANADNAVLLIEINGAGGGGLAGLFIFSTGSGSTIRGLVINRFDGDAKGINLQATNCVIEGNFIGTDPTGTIAFNLSGDGIQTFNGGGNVIGGVLPGQRNVISGHKGNGININDVDNVIQGNFIGVDASGTNALPNGTVGGSGVRIVSFASGNLVGGTDAGARNIISGNASGIDIIGDTCCNVVQGNFIGTDATGTQPLGNASGGVFLEISSGGHLIGGTTPEARNIISGNGAHGVVLGNVSFSSPNETNDVVQGNFIGTDVTGTLALGNGLDGVEIIEATSATIGGANAGAGNIIAHNGRFGISVLVNGATNNQFLGNAIFDNGNLGIDLLGDGVTPNDDGDADTGPNNLQNFPKITAVAASGSNVTISGALNSRLSTAYRVEFFANDTADPTGFGEGQTFLGFADVTTDTFGNAVFDVSFPFAGSVNTVTATATDPSGNTSEFSHAFGIKLQNISTRLNVLTGENVLIGGFIITGESPKQVIVRAIGPSLSISGGVLEDPVLELHEADGSVVTNDNWKDTQQSEIEATGIPPSDDLESAIVASLAPGAHTAIVSGKNNGTGVALVEAYDLDQTLGPILANISTRGFVDTGNNVMIGGFIVGPTDTGLADILVRGIGPSLGAFDIANPLLDPILELHDANGTLLTTNDNWKDTQQTEIEATGIPPTDDNESVILQSLAPGAYTAILKGVNDTTGVGLVEVYHLQ